MSLSVKDIARSHWPRIIDRSAAYMTVNDGDFTGEVGLLRLNRVKAPLEKTYDGRPVRIVDDGYYWLQLAAPNVPYWLTAMYDDKGRTISISVPFFDT